MSNSVKAAIAISVAIAFVGLVYCITNYMGSRYGVETIDKITYRVDRHTGEMSIIRPNGVITKAKEPKVIEDRELFDSERNELEGWGGLKYGGESFEVNVYNGNKDVTVMELDVGLSYTNEDRTANRVYKQKVKIGPLQTGNVYFKVVNPGRDLNFSGWFIDDARGHSSYEEDESQE